MKKLLIAAIVFHGMTSAAQITVAEQTKTIHIGKVIAGFQTVAELKAEVGSDTTYFFTFVNHKYPSLGQYETITFKGGQTTLDQLKGLMLSVFEEKNKKNADYKQTLKLGDTPVIIANYRSMGTATCQFYAGLGYVNLTQSQIIKLFGKS